MGNSYLCLRELILALIINTLCMNCKYQYMSCTPCQCQKPGYWNKVRSIHLICDLVYNSSVKAKYVKCLMLLDEESDCDCMLPKKYLETFRTTSTPHHHKLAS